MWLCVPEIPALGSQVGRILDLSRPTSLAYQMSSRSVSDPLSKNKMESD